VLTEGGYFVALSVYILSALLALVLLNLWLLRGRGLGLRLLISLPLAALLLTPAYIQPGAETLAPALVVLAFQWLSLGPEAAEHALRPLALFTGASFALGLLGAMLLLWRNPRGEQEEPSA
jgi:hypothetical protein